MSLAENNGKGCTAHTSIPTLLAASRAGEKQLNITVTTPEPTSRLWEICASIRALEEETVDDTSWHLKLAVEQGFLTISCVMLTHFQIPFFLKSAQARFAALTLTISSVVEF